MKEFFITHLRHVEGAPKALSEVLGAAGQRRPELQTRRHEPCIHAQAGISSVAAGRDTEDSTRSGIMRLRVWGMRRCDSGRPQLSWLDCGS